MVIKFTKMEGLGNDFMVINLTDQENLSCNLSPQIIRQLADRRRGVGFDQLLTIEASQKPGIDFNYQIYNSDGSKAEQCGNGARCIGKYIFDQQLTTKKKLFIKAPQSIIEIWSKDHDQIVVSMDKPEFDPEKFPLRTQFLAYLNDPALLSQESKPYLPAYPVKINHKILKCYIVKIGNPHVIILAEDHDNNNEIKNLDELDIIGKEFNQHPAFPLGVNVSLIKILNTHHIKLSVYERGAGLTPACGSAACASAAMTIKQGWTQSPVTVTQSGGELLIMWQNDNHPLLMQGPAKTIYTGQLSL